MDNIESHTRILEFSPAVRRLLGGLFAVFALGGCQPERPHTPDELLGMRAAIENELQSAAAAGKLSEKQRKEAGCDDINNVDRLCYLGKPASASTAPCPCKCDETKNPKPEASVATISPKKQPGDLDCDDPHLDKSLEYLCAERKLREKAVAEAKLAAETPDKKLQKKFNSGKYPLSKEAFNIFETVYAAGVAYLNQRRTLVNPNGRGKIDARLIYLQELRNKLMSEWTANGNDTDLSGVITSATDNIEKIAVLYLQTPEDALKMGMKKKDRLPRDKKK